MNHAKKMVMVPYDSSYCTSQPSTVQTPGTHLTHSDEEMKKILDADHFMSDREKWLQYSQTLQRCLKQSNPTIEPLQTEEPVDKLRITEEYILESVPKTFRRRAKFFIDYARQMHITWNNNGRVIINGVLIPASNIIDTVNDAVRSRKNFVSVGRKEVSKALRLTGIPRTFIGNDRFWVEGNNEITDDGNRTDIVTGHNVVNTGSTGNQDVSRVQQIENNLANASSANRSVVDMSYRDVSGVHLLNTSSETESPPSYLGGYGTIIENSPPPIRSDRCLSLYNNWYNLSHNQYSLRIYHSKDVET